jgi:hypothetical protein
MKKSFSISVALVALLGFTVVSALALEPPKITLDRVEVATIQPFFVKPRVGFKDEKDTGKDMPVGSILSLAYILDIKNPNKEPIMLDEMTFTTEFEGFEVNTAMVYEDSWIPAGKTNQVRVVVANETLPTIGSLSVGAGNVAKLQEMKKTPAEMVKKWWETIGDFPFPITIAGGTALFKDAKGKEIQATFSGTFKQ